jgi:hypothetical protein
MNTMRKNEHPPVLARLSKQSVPEIDEKTKVS